MRFVPRTLFPLFVLTIAMFPSFARAQIYEVNNGTSTPNAGIGHDYIKMLSETVNPANGSVSIRIRAAVPPGRQLNFPFSFAYDSSSAYAAQGDGIGSAGLWGTSQFLEDSGWSYSVPTQTNMGITTYDNLGRQNCILTTGYVFQDSAGTRYGFHGLVGFLHAPRMCTGDVDRTSDSVDFYSASMGGCGQSVVVSDLKNTTYTFPGSTCNDTGGDPFSTLPTSIEDRNGNIVRISNPGTPSFGVTDTLGRNVLSSSGFGTTGNAITVFGLSPYSLTWANVSATFSPGFTRDNPNQWCPSTFGGPGGGHVVTAITLPNGMQYTISYDPTYGLPSKITYPTGGYVSYSWTLNTRSDYAQVPNINGNPQSCDYTYDTPALAHRYVSFDGSTIALQQDFSYSPTTWNPNDFTSWTSKQTTVTTHDLVQAITYQTVYNYTPINVPTASPFLPSHWGGQMPMEQSIIYKNTDGTTLRTVNKTWADQYLITIPLLGPL